MGQVGHLGDRGAAGETKQIGPFGQHRPRIHPDQMGGELVGRLRRPVRERVATADPDVDGFQRLHQRGAVMPRDAAEGREHVVAGERRKRHRDRLLHPELAREGAVFAGDGGEDVPVVADEVHLVDRQDRPADSGQLGDIEVSAGLGRNALLGIDQDDGEIGVRRPGDHVPRVALVAGRVDGDELACFGLEMARGEIARPGAVRQAVEQGRLAVARRAAKDEAEPLLRLHCPSVDFLP